MSSFYFIPALLILLCYFFLILAFYIGWLRSKRYQPEETQPVTHISILIPCRNEQDNIRELSECLIKQNYPSDLVEIIWIDDHSTDGTAYIIETLLLTNPNHRLVNMSGQVSGKKASLKAGMKIASGELILLTDADSRPGIQWVYTLARFFEDTGTDLILGPVVIGPAESWSEKIQKLEFLSLVASSIGAAGIGHPIMAQGPNIAVRASDYASLVNNLDNRYASGDDVFLLQAMKRIKGKKIGYLLNPEAIVTSKPANSLSGFMHQRQRWASKSAGYSDPFMIFTVLLVFMANLVIFLSLIGALLGIAPISIFLLLVGIKTLADLLLLAVAAKFFHCTRLLIWLIPVQLLYPAYVIITGALSQLIPVRWKNARPLDKITR